MYDNILAKYSKDFNEINWASEIISGFAGYRNLTDNCWIFAKTYLALELHVRKNKTNKNIIICAEYRSEWVSGSDDSVFAGATTLVVDYKNVTMFGQIGSDMKITCVFAGHYLENTSFEGLQRYCREYYAKYFNTDLNNITSVEYLVNLDQTKD